MVAILKNIIVFMISARVFLLAHNFNIISIFIFLLTYLRYNYLYFYFLLTYLMVVIVIEAAMP